MESKRKTYKYKAFGLIFESEIELPELLPGPGTPDVFIRIDKTDNRIPESSVSSYFKQASPDEFHLQIKNVALYIIKNGREIIVKPFRKTTVDEISLFLLGSAFGALFHQRGLLPVHGSAVEINNRAIIFSGNSGAGKSTLAAAFLNKGFHVLNDDICVIDFNKENQPIVLAGYPRLKLWDDTLDMIGENPEKLKKIRPDINKHGLPLKENFYSSPLPLGMIYILSPKENTNFQIRKLSGIKKFEALKDNTYRFQFIMDINQSENHFEMVSRVAGQTETREIIREGKKQQPEVLVQHILDDLKSL